MIIWPKSLPKISDEIENKKAFGGEKNDRNQRTSSTLGMSRDAKGHLSRLEKPSFCIGKASFRKSIRHVSLLEIQELGA